jgi:hypothetical protein
VSTFARIYPSSCQGVVFEAHGPRPLRMPYGRSVLSSGKLMNNLYSRLLGVWRVFFEWAER